MSVSYAASVQSTTGTIASYARKMAQNGSKPNVEILIDDHRPGKVYTTFDGVTGKVNITAPHNARFDDIRITLEGTTKTYVENLSPTSTRSKTLALHNFLKLVMPMRESDYPQPRIAEAGRTYSFPFNFNIPDQLLPRACTHRVTADHVHQAHLQLPPSLADWEVSGQDDLAPEMSKITYAIKVRVLRNRDEDDKEVVLVEGHKKIRVVPAVPETPPMSLGHGEHDYVLSKTKVLRKGMFSGKLGQITVSAAQMGALILPSPTSQSATPATTMATLKLRFDPHTASSEPPKLGGLTTKIKAITFYAARPATAIPTRMSMLCQYETTRGIYHTTQSLSSRCVESVVWAKQEPKPVGKRRNSDSSTCSSDCSESRLETEHKESPAYYSATVLVPITLPTTKTWVPTFHSCIVSRVYIIDLSLTVHTPGTGVPSSSLSLHLPVQIAATGNQTHRAQLTPAEAAAELANANEFFRPRVIEVPDEELLGNSVLRPISPIASVIPAHHTSEQPPSYEDFFSQSRAIVDPGRS